MPLTAARALQDLCPFVLGDHPLELHEQPILGTRALGCLHKERLDPVPSELLDQQHLVRIFAAQTIGGIGEHGLAFGGQIPYPLEPRPLERRTKARATIVPMVRPLLLAYARNKRIVVGGSLSVIGTVASMTSTGRSSRAASSRYR